MSCLIVDDSPVFRRAAQALLEADGVTVVGLAATGEEALGLDALLRPQVVLLDVDLGGDDGFAVAAALQGRATSDRPPVSVVMVSTRAAEEYAGRLDLAPVAGFLPKEELSGAALEALLTP